MAVHTCTRCPLRFAHRAELMDHLDHDHDVPPEALEQIRYPGAHSAEPLYRSFAGDDDVHTVLVVANQTIGSDTLTDAIQELKKRHDRLAVFVVVPATPSQHLVSDAGGRLPPPSEGLDGRTDDAGLAQARFRLRTALRMLSDAGVVADGRVADPNPVVAVGRAMEDQPIDSVLLSTLHPTMSRWLQADLPATLERRFSVPVTTLTARRPAPTASP